jgi:hypothetical protein
LRSRSILDRRTRHPRIDFLERFAFQQLGVSGARWWHRRGTLRVREILLRRKSLILAEIVLDSEKGDPQYTDRAFLLTR